MAAVRHVEAQPENSQTTQQPGLIHLRHNTNFQLSHQTTEGSRMKTFLKAAIAVLAIVMLVVIIHDSMTSQGKQWTGLFRVIIVDDSLRVGGPTTVNGNLTVSGTTTSGTTVVNDSIASKLIIRDSLRVRNGFTLGAGYFKGNASMRGTDAFTTTATLDTVVLTGLLSTDVCFVCTKRQAAPGTAEFLSCFPGANGDTLFVARNTGTTSALAYTYLILR
jgi:hypothetical protein